MSVPVGPHGSLLVAVDTRQPDQAKLWFQLPTIADLDLDMGVSFGHILDTSYNFRHDCERRKEVYTEDMGTLSNCELRIRLLRALVGDAPEAH